MRATRASGDGRAAINPIPLRLSILQGYNDNGMTSYYGDNGTEPHTIWNDTFGVGYNHDCIYYPYVSPYVMVSYGSQEQEQPSSQPTTITVNCNMIHQHQICSNPCRYNERNSGPEMTQTTSDSSSSCICQRHLKGKTFISGMTSSVVNNDLSQETQPSTKNKTIKSTSSSMTTVTDGTVVSVCKRTILSAIQKIIIEDYKSAMYKICKTIRILDTLMFNEGCTGIGSAEIEPVRPWLEILKDMKQQISLKLQHQYNDKRYNDAESRTIPKAKDSYHRRNHRNRSHIGSRSYQFSRNLSSSSSSSDEDRSRHVSYHSRKSYTRISDNRQVDFSANSTTTSYTGP